MQCQQLVCNFIQGIQNYQRVQVPGSSSGVGDAQLCIQAQKALEDDGMNVSVADLNELLNHTNSAVTEACAVSGLGVFETLKIVCKQVIAKTA